MCAETSVAPTDLIPTPDATMVLRMLRRLSNVAALALSFSLPLMGALLLTCGGPETVQVLNPDLPEPVPEPRPVRTVPRTTVRVVDGPRHPLDTFFRKLQALELADREQQEGQGGPAADVRVLHMGASHTASDTVTGPLRLEFSRRFGEGGRGFIQPGVPWRRFRQLSATYDMGGEWLAHNGMRRDAIAPFGLGGVRLESNVAGDWFTRASCPECELGQAMDGVTLHYLKVPAGGSFNVYVDGYLHRTISTALTAADLADVPVAPTDPDPDWAVDPADEEARLATGTGLTVPGLGVEEYPVALPGESPAMWAPATLHIDLPEEHHEIRVEVVGDGSVSFTGVTTTSERAGVTYSAVGLNGSQGGHFTGFDESMFLSDAAIIEPDLVIFAWGINETYSDRYLPTSPDPTEQEWIDAGEHHRRVYSDLVRRFRQVNPQTACIFLLPTDLNPQEHPARMAGAPPCTADPVTGIDEASCAMALPRTHRVIRDAQERAAADMGCLVWDQQYAMGGPGGMALWQVVDPPLAASDGVHLTMRGYESLARTFFYDLMDTYELWKREPSPEVPLLTSRIPVLAPPPTELNVSYEPWALQSMWQ